MEQHKTGVWILRIGLASVFLWFGFSQLIDGVHWVSWVPEWAPAIMHLPPAMIVLANGAFEVICGTMLALGFFVRPVAALLALHLAILVLSIGLTQIGVRDFGLMMANLALVFL
ncbi:DoxX family membrane protein [Patescibacteria group bacterium]|nr:DoxX family membrane protein [Patescibacteria group bacterium]